jgi:hypothetical protein
MIALVLCFLIGDDGNDVVDDGEEGGLEPAQEINFFVFCDL